MLKWNRSFSILLFTHCICFTMIGQTGYNVNILPVGDLEPLLANTGTGGLASTGAVYYNPAALTQLDQNSLSIKGTAYTLFNFKSDPAAVIDGQKLVYESSGFQSIPTSLIIVRKINNWRGAFSVIIPMAFNFEGLTTWDIGNPQYGKLEILQNYKERMMLIGFTAARKISDHFSLGLSVFGQSYSYLSSLNLNYKRLDDPEFFVTTSEREQYNPFNLIFIAGIFHEGSKWNYGARISFPNIHLFGKGDYSNSTYAKTSPIEPAEVEALIVKDAKVEFQTPFDFRLGCTFKPKNNLRIATDLSYTMKVTLDPLGIAGYDNSIHFKGSLRASAGTEIGISDSFLVYAGGSFNPLHSESTSETFVQDFYSFTGGIRINTKFTRSTLGFHYTKGTGERKFNNSIDPSDESYGYLGAFIGTSYVF